jgi:MauM/NapG family ferredoxin protein
MGRFNLKRHKWILTRRISQWIWLGIFAVLFVMTDYSGYGEPPCTVSFFFRINPLAGLTAMLSSRMWILLLLPGLFFLLSSLFLGRWFCGWMCPLGTLLDSVHPVIKGKQTLPGNPRRTIRFALLIILLVSALFGYQLAGLFDPFAILVRGLAVSVYPAFNSGVRSFFSFTYNTGNDAVNAVTEPVYAMLKATLLPFQNSVFKWSLVSGLLLIAVFVLEKWERRGFCRNICPLGALYGLVSRFGLMRGHHEGHACDTCFLCRKICRMGAIDDQGRISMADCNLCMECVEKCPSSKIAFRWTERKNAAQPAGTGISRRTFIGAAITGTVLPPLLGVHADTTDRTRLLRPPGARDEREFLARCVRCGICMKVCIGNALHPAMFESGLSGLFSPILLTRAGYCEYNCTLCGQVCPTGAIERLEQDVKQRWVIGKAEFDTSRCLPYQGIPCLVCEEHCPVPGKAIRTREVDMQVSPGKTIRIKQPFIRLGRCIGCGICENKCPLPGPAAVRVFSQKTSSGPGWN